MGKPTIPTQNPKTLEDRKKRRDEVDQAMLAHAQRLWEAESANAERIESRVKLYGGAVFATLGLGLYRVEWFMRPDDLSRVHWPLAVCVIKLILAAGLLCLAIGLMGLHRRSVERLFRMSSQLLPFAPQDQGKAVMRVTYARTYNAAMDLQARNLERLDGLDKAKPWFTRGVTLVLVSILMYICLSAPPLRARSQEHGNDARTSTRTSDPTGASNPQPGDPRGRAEGGREP